MASKWLPADRKQFSMGRRNCLKCLATAVSGIVGCTSDVQGTPTYEVRPIDTYGYAGSRVVSQPPLLSIEVEDGTQRPSFEVTTEAELLKNGVTHSRTLETSGVDWFAFEVNPRESTSLVVRKRNEGGLWMIVFYDSDGSFLTHMYLDGNGSRLVSVEQAGFYFVQVADVGSNSGSYTITTDVEGVARDVSVPRSRSRLQVPERGQQREPSRSTYRVYRTSSGKHRPSHRIQGYGEFGYDGIARRPPRSE